MTKNTLLLTALFAFSSFVSAHDQTAEKATKVFTFEYTVQAKNNNDLTDWQNANNSLMEHINKTTRGNGSNFYENILNFIQEVQQSIAAGLNLFGIISTSQETLGQIVQTVAVDAATPQNVANVEQTVTAVEQDITTAEQDATAVQQDVTTAEQDIANVEQNVASVEQVVNAAIATDTAATTTAKSIEEDDAVVIYDAAAQDDEDQAASTEVIPTLSISLSLLSSDEADEAAWITAKEMLQDLKAQAATGELSPEDFVEKLSAIFEFVDQSSLHGSLQISSTAA